MRHALPLSLYLNGYRIQVPTTTQQLYLACHVRSKFRHSLQKDLRKAFLFSGEASLSGFSESSSFLTQSRSLGGRSRMWATLSYATLEHIRMKFCAFVLPSSFSKRGRVSVGCPLRLLWARPIGHSLPEHPFRRTHSLTEGVMMDQSVRQLA